jgi:glycosyltransferase involved in cell wall biosynthesis
MSARLPSVLFVTSEMIGPFKNGGIGTATSGLIETVAGMGCPTTVLYTGAIWHVEIKIQRWINHYAQIGVELIPMPLQQMCRIAGPVVQYGVGSAYLVYQFLKQRRFDVIHFNDTLGEGMYALTAKHLGIALSGTRIYLGMHGPTSWAYRLNGEPMDRMHDAAFDAMERVSIEAADAPWGPSAYLVRDLRAHDFVIPVEPVVRQLVMPTPRLFDPDPAKFAEADQLKPPRQVRPVEEIVFFGRLERRKGLLTFCDALDLLADRLSASGIRVTFLGKPVQQHGGSTDIELRARGAAWPFSWGIESNFGQPEAVRYLLERRAVAVMPSPFDNSPCTIYEAIQFGFPFLSSVNGGIPELVDPEDRPRVLFEYSAEGIAQALARVLEDGAQTVRPRIAPDKRRRAWQALHHAIVPAPGPEPVAARAAEFAVLVDAGSADQMLRTWRSVDQVLGPRAVLKIALVDPRVGGAALSGVVQLDPADAGTPMALAVLIERASWLLCMTAGTTLIASTLPSLDIALDAPSVTAGLIPAGLDRGRIVPPMGRAPAFGYFEGYLYTGGAIVAAGCAAALLRQDVTLPGAAFFGLIDATAASAPGLWPFPEPLFVLPRRSRQRLPMLDLARNRLFTAVSSTDAGLITAIGRAMPDGRPRGSRARTLLLVLAGLPIFPLIRPLVPQLLGLAITLWLRLKRLKAMLGRG